VTPLSNEGALNPFEGGGVLPPESASMGSAGMRIQAGRLEAAIPVDADLERAFETQLVESSRLAFRVAFAVLRHRQDAEDVAQEAFIKAHRHFHSLRDRNRFRPWLVRVTWRLALDRQRSDRRRLVREQGEADARPTAGDAQDAAVERDRATRLWRAIDALPEKLRLVVVLVNIEGHDVAAAAELLRLPEGTVKSRLFLARQKLKESLSCATK
jgi:RNA polymerase sigma-70 factor (ECF subfamily)